MFTYGTHHLFSSFASFTVNFPNSGNPCADIVGSDEDGGECCSSVLLDLSLNTPHSVFISSSRQLVNELGVIEMRVGVTKG